VADRVYKNDVSERELEREKEREVERGRER
jgi:hypothetical protein